MSLENITDEARDQLADLADSLSRNPKTREAFLRMTRSVRPNLPIPELDLKDMGAAELKKRDDKIASLEARLIEHDVIEGIKEKRQALVEKGLAKREDIPTIEKLMLDRKIPDYETAAEFHKLQKQIATPTPASVTEVRLPESVKDIMKNPTQWARGEAYKALEDLQKRNT
jgi:hypothetical protein